MRLLSSQLSILSLLLCRRRRGRGGRVGGGQLLRLGVQFTPLEGGRGVYGILECLGRRGAAGVRVPCWELNTDPQDCVAGTCGRRMKVKMGLRV